MRFTLSTLILFSLLPLVLPAQDADLIAPEAIGGALTKSMQGLLSPDKNQLVQLAAINQRSAAAVVEARQASTTGESFDQAAARWQAELRQVLTPEQWAGFEKMREARLRELRLAGLPRWSADLVQALDLSERQIRDVNRLHEEYAAGLAQLQQSGDPANVKSRRLRALEANRDEGLRQVLNDAQFSRYQQRKTEGWSEQ